MTPQAAEPSTSSANSTTSQTALSTAYHPQALEHEMYQFWLQQGCFRPESQVASQVVAENAPAFSLVIPPPNVTGTLHMGHALDCTIQDILTRYYRMSGYATLWMPGMDHAGIATQTVVERELKKEGKTRQDLGRDAFVEKAWHWANARRGDIRSQFQRLGISPDWDRERFTMDEGLCTAVREAFVRLYEQGLIYRGTYIVNWDPVSCSAISDIEVEYSEEESFLWQIAYPVVGTNENIVVATTRPETMFGDVAVAVHPEDPRYQHLIGKMVRLPLTHREIPILADTYVEREFGTGALKITPAHDPNDYQIGLRHKLTPLVILDETGHLKTVDEVPQTLRGLDRFEARKQAEAMLEAQGFLIKKEAHTHRVGRAQRSGAVIEPLLSMQWFVKTEPLAKQALTALDAGQIRFVPERWTKDYVRWLANIQDWCISRQLWWGHNIPAWYCNACGHGPMVSRETPTACTECASADLKQDPDVLDTWFSSGLWPFSTMGWPNMDASDLKQFFPTHTLVTGFDIIFFWVARMTMMSHGLMGQSPFSTVYIHGLIRDEHGQKMSKSKGNTVDPVESIETYGCDGFRYALASLITYGGQDIKLAKDKLEQGKLFANKLWNASRFVLMNLDGHTIEPKLSAYSDFSVMDQWILARYERTVMEANRMLTEYRFGEYAGEVYEFAWNAFCDWYVEYAKKQLKEPQHADRTRTILYTILTGLHQLLHPAMPYLTEAIWQKLPKPLGTEPLSISLSTYPSVTTPQWQNDTVVAQVELMIETVRAIRNLRQSYTIPHSAEVPIVIEAPQAADLKALEVGKEMIGHFVKLSQFDVVANLAQPPEQSATNVVGHSRIYLPLAGLIDVTQERDRLSKKQVALEKERDQLRGRLGSMDFVEKAPKDVVEKQTARLQEILEQLTAIAEQLTQLP